MVVRESAKGFTLVELLVVIAIIALLMAILMPALSMAKKQAQGARCLANMKQIGLAVHLYADDYGRKVPRDETNGFWAMLFMPYIGGLSSNVAAYHEVDIYDCAAYPDKEQTVDYAINAMDLKSPTPNVEQRGATSLDAFPRHGTTIYLADYEHHPDWSHIKIIRKTDTPAELIDKLKWLDVWHTAHLPSSNTERRVARERHGRNGVNCLFVDGHSAKMDSLEITSYDFGRPASD